MCLYIYIIYIYIYDGLLICLPISTMLNVGKKHVSKEKYYGLILFISFLFFHLY